MKINAINTHIHKNGTRKNISFKAGKIELFSDFDRTYFPPSHAGMKVMSPSEYPGFVQYCQNFKNFFNNTREGLKFHITSGRTLGEYQVISELIKEKGFDLPLPDTFIAKNGSDEYLKIGTDEDFYKKGIFPFRYDTTNVEKENRIKKLMGWDGPKIKAKLKEILKEHDFRIVEGDSEHGPGDYGAKSLFADGKLSYEVNKTFYGTDKPEWVAGLRNDGNCKIFVTYPPDMATTPERVDVLKKINKKMNEYEKSIGVKKIHSYTPKQETKTCGGRLCAVFEPQVDETLMCKLDKQSLQGLTKLYDTKEAVKKAIKNNDLVIVAGDSSNDFTMLNPLLYIDAPIPNERVNMKSPSMLVKSFDTNNPVHQKIAKQIDDLPLMCVVVKSGDKSELSSITVAFDNSDSRFYKVVTVPEGKLEDGIKEAVRLYCKRHPKYAEKLNPDLKKEIFGTTGDISEFLTDTAESFLPKAKNDIKNTNATSNKNMGEVVNSISENAKKNLTPKYFAIGALVLSGIVAAILCIKKICFKNPAIKTNSV